MRILLLSHRLPQFLLFRFHQSKTGRDYILIFLKNALYALLLGTLFDNILAWKMIDLKAYLVIAGDIESNPGPDRERGLKFFHWNLNSICARSGAKIPLIEAYNSIHRFDVVAISETILNSSVDNDCITIEGLRKDIFRSDHPSNKTIGGVCLYFREGLPIRCRRDLECIQEMAVAEITIVRKKLLFATVYRSPIQSPEQFNGFIDHL